MGGILAEYKKWDDPCTICGDVGFRELLLTCSCCKLNREHTYCMLSPLKNAPESWTCEKCRSSHGMASSNCFEDGYIPKAKRSKLSRSSHKEPVHFPVSIHHYRASKTSKTKFIAPEEILKMPSEREQRKCSSRSSSRYGRSENRTGMRKSIAVESSKFSSASTQSRMGINSVKKQEESRTSLGLQGGKSPELAKKKDGCGQDSMGFRMSTGNIECSIARVDEFPSSRNAYIKEPMGFRTSFQNNEGSSTTTGEGNSSFSRHSPKYALATINSGDALHAGSVAKGNDVKVSKRQDVLDIETDDIFNISPMNFVWCGSFELDLSSSSRYFDGFRACQFGQIHRRAIEMTKMLPGILKSRLLPCSSVWGDIFQNDLPDLNDIALYIFPGPFDRSKEQYFSLLKLIETEDLVLRSSLDDTELLVTTSKRLNVEWRGLRVNSFLWGIYWPMKDSVEAPRRLYELLPHTKAENSDALAKAKVVQRFSEVKPEQQDFFDPPSGFGRRCSHGRAEQQEYTHAPPGFPRHR